MSDYATAFLVALCLSGWLCWLYVYLQIRDARAKIEKFETKWEARREFQKHKFKQEIKDKTFDQVADLWDADMDAFIKSGLRD